MATEQTPQKQPKTEKCTCSKQIDDLKTEIAVLRHEIAVLRHAMQGGR